MCPARLPAPEGCQADPASALHRLVPGQEAALGPEPCEGAQAGRGRDQEPALRCTEVSSALLIAVAEGPLRQVFALRHRLQL